MDNVINDTTLTLTSFDNLIMTDGSLTMPDGGYSLVGNDRWRKGENLDGNYIKDQNLSEKRN